MQFLVVDDDQFIVNLIRSFLEEASYNVLCALDGEEALKLFEKEKVDILITDIKMPGINGFELIEKVRAINDDLEVIVITGYGSADIIIESLRRGVSDFIEKPFRISTILKAIKKPIERVELKEKKATLEQELKAKEKRLLHQEKLASLGRLLAGIAHEINNPITFIKGNLQNMQLFWNGFEQAFLSIDSNWKIGTYEKEDAIKSFTNLLKDAVQGVDRVSGLVRVLRNFGRQSNEFSMIDLGESINNSLKVMADALHQNEIKITKNLPDREVIVRGNSPLLEQVFINLISNSIDALNNGAQEKIIEIFLDIDEKSKVVRINFKDTGSGIREEDKDKLFEPFFTDKDIGEGTGLGLSISYEIIKKHRGEIEIQSEYEKGTTAIISLPVHEQMN